MAMDNPSYFTIPGGLSSSTHKVSRFSLLKRHVRMGSTPSAPPPPSPCSPGSGHVVQCERYSSPPSAIASTTMPPSHLSSRTVLAGAGLEAPIQTQMLVLGMPRVCDVAPQGMCPGPYRSSSDLFSSYYNLGTAPPSRRHSIGAYFVRKSTVTLNRKRAGIAEEIPTKEEVALVRPQDIINKGTRPAVMEDIIIISSQKSQAAELWVTYLKTCFEQIRKNKNKPPFRILCITVEDIDANTSMSPVLESKLRQARLEIVIMCPIFLDFVLQYPERSCKLAAHLQPTNVLAMLLGLEEKTLTEQHKAALMSFSQWKKMESVKDRDEKFVSDFLGAAMEILGKSPTKLVNAPEKNQFMLIPKKVNQCQKKIVIVLNEPFEKEDVVRVSIVRNGEDLEVPGVLRRNPYTLAFRVPDVYLGLTALVSVKVSKNGRELGSKQLKCESQMHALEQALKGCDQPMDFSCQALNIVPTDKSKLDELFVKAFQRNVPPNFSLLQSAGLGQVTRGAVSKEEFPTLLHFAARFGLEQLSWALLECPGGDVASELRNNKELTPAEMAEAAGHARLSNLLCGYMQMTQFSSAYTFLKGIIDGKQDGNCTQSEEYLNPRPVMDTYQVPPCPRPCAPSETPPPPLGYMPMRSPLGKVPVKPKEELIEQSPQLGSLSDILHHRSSSEEQSDNRRKDANSNGVEEELIEIINDFKNNVFTISEVEALVNQWRRRNDVQQSFREKQEHLTKLREEYERVQQKMKDEMTQVGRPSPMERIRMFFRGKSKESKDNKGIKRKSKADKKRGKEEGTGSRPASSLSILSSSSSGSSSGRMSTASGGSLGESCVNSDQEYERRFWRAAGTVSLENYDIPPSPVCLRTAVGGNYEIPPSPVPVVTAVGSNHGVPSNPMECSEYCNMPTSTNESALYAKVSKPGLKTVMEEDRKTDNRYINLPEEPMPPNSVPGPLTIIEPGIDCHLPDYVNVENQGIQLKCN